MRNLLLTLVAAVAITPSCKLPQERVVIAAEPVRLLLHVSVFGLPLLLPVPREIVEADPLLAAAVALHMFQELSRADGAAEPVYMLLHVPALGIPLLLPVHVPIPRIVKWKPRPLRPKPLPLM